MKKLVTGIVIVLAVAACGSSDGPGGITFSPAAINCSSPAAMTVTVLLPSSLHTGDTITQKLDSKTLGSAAVNTYAVPKPDGSWSSVSQTNVADLKAACDASTANSVAEPGFTSGTHTEQILDSSGKVVAEGSYVVTR